MKGPGASLVQGLVADIEFDGSLVDSVTNSDADCADAECPTFAAGLHGEAAVFDGAATCVHVPWLANWTPSTYTIAAWIAPTMMSGPVVVREHDTSCPGPELDSSDSSVGFVATDKSGGHQMAWSSSVLTPEAWTHVAIEFDGANQSVFVNGGCACSIEPTIPLDYADYEVTIGCYPAANTFFAGAIDNVRIYDRALDTEELALLAGTSNNTDCSAVCNTVQP
jgi:hypothetical protein